MMRAFRWGAVVAVVVLLAGCASGSTATETPLFPPVSPTPTVAAGTVVGWEASGVVCQPEYPTGEVQVVPEPIVALTVCDPANGMRAELSSVTLTGSDPAFVPLLDALSLPSETTDEVVPCPAMAEMPRPIFATDGSGAVFQVQPPMDQCGFIRQEVRVVLDALLFPSTPSTDCCPNDPFSGACPSDVPMCPDDGVPNIVPQQEVATANSVEPGAVG